MGYKEIDRDKNREICMNCRTLTSDEIINYVLTNPCLQVWKAEADDICGYDGTILVAVKTVKVSHSAHAWFVRLYSIVLYNV